MKRRLNQTKQRNIFLKRKFHPNLRDAYSKSNIFVNQIKTKNLYLLLCGLGEPMLPQVQKRCPNYKTEYTIFVEK